MNYSIEIGKIVEGSLKSDLLKVKNYTKMLIDKLIVDGEERVASKFSKLLKNEEMKELKPNSLDSFIGNIPVDNESRISLADYISPKDNAANVILSDNNTSNLKSFILNYKNADKLNQLGVGVSNTLLLYGPPGCGKTECAKWIAKELNLPLITARLDSMISSYLGTTAKNIRTLFEYAQRVPCVLFLDEFDALAKARDDNNELGELKRVVNSLLQNIDTMSKDSLLIAATNHAQLLDSAVWRRFDYKLEVSLPDQKTIRSMLDLFINNSLNISDKDKDYLSYAFKNLSGSNIEEIIKKSIRNAIVHNQQFSVQKIYREFFLYKNFSNPDEDKKNYQKQVCSYLYNEIGKPFSYDLISEILHISKSQIKPLLDNSEGEENE